MLSINRISSLSRPLINSSRNYTVVISRFGGNYSEEPSDLNNELINSLGCDPYPTTRKERLKPFERRKLLKQKKVASIASSKVRSLVDFLSYQHEQGI